MKLTELLYDLFANRIDFYAEAYLNSERTRMAYVKKEGLTLDLIEKHINGEKTIGLYQLYHDNKVKWGCFDFDKNTQEDFDKAKILYKYLKKKGYHPLMENSGGGEFKVHIWLFVDTDAVSIKNFMEETCKEIGIMPNEVFPKQTSISQEDFGNLVKLPLAYHLVTNKRSFFYDDDFKQEEDYIKVLNFHLQNKDEIQKVKIIEKTLIIGSPAELESHDCAFMNYCLAHELPKGKRHEIISRNMAWYIIHHPNGESIKEQYVKMQQGVDQELNGWIKGVEKGKATPICCGELINYQKEFKLPLKCKGCSKFEDYKKEKKAEDEMKKKILSEQKEKKAEEENYVLDSFSIFTDYLDIAKKFIKTHPIYYDSGKNWWLWNNEKKCYIFTDETDIMNALDDKTKNPSAKSSIKNEILESLRRVGRRNKPKDFKKTWIQFKDKIIDFMSGEEFDATAEYFSTNPINWNVGDNEETPTIDKLFSDWIGKENILTLYQIIAYCLITDYPIHRIFCLFGEGLNGKSCYLRLLKNFIGESNCTATELELLLNSHFEITRMHKKLVAMMTETNFEEMAKTAIIKKLTGQDLIGYEYKNKNPFDDVNYAKILISTNNLPPTTDKTIGFYRRWLIIDFLNRFEEGKDVIGSIPEIEYNNLAKKCIRILKELLECGKFHNEGEIEERTKRYEDRSNPFDKFFRDNVVEDYDSFIGKTEFKRRLEEFCKENRFRIMSEGTISKKMKDFNVFDSMKDYYQNGERHNFRVWLSIKWRDVTDVTTVTGICSPFLHAKTNIEVLLHPLHPLQPVIKEEKVT